MPRENKAYTYTEESLKNHFIALCKKHIGDFNFIPISHFNEDLNELFIDIEVNESILSEEGWLSYKNYSSKLKPLSNKQGSQLFIQLLKDEFNSTNRTYSFHLMVKNTNELIVIFEENI